jgi:hypothetical protein
MYKVCLYYISHLDGKQYYDLAAYNPKIARHYINTPRTRTHTRFDLETANRIAEYWQATNKYKVVIEEIK